MQDCRIFNKINIGKWGIYLRICLKTNNSPCEHELWVKGQLNVYLQHFGHFPIYLNVALKFWGRQKPLLIYGIYLRMCLKSKLLTVYNKNTYCGSIFWPIRWNVALKCCSIQEEAFLLVPRWLLTTYNNFQNDLKRFRKWNICVKLGNKHQNKKRLFL